MSSAEFDLIRQYFSHEASDDSIVLGNGDDCALLSIPPSRYLAISVDTLISGVHFPADASSEDIAYKALMVNLSDLASMGATPRWVTLAISLPDIDHDWLTAFSDQLKQLLSRYGISLLGGDTTKGHLSITMQAMGTVEKGAQMTRDAAKPGERIYVTGNIGDAAVGLKVIQQGLTDEKLTSTIDALNRPQVHPGFAEQLPRVSRCAIDISDGLLADLGHVLEASSKHQSCGAEILLDRLPVSQSARYYFDHYHDGAADWPLLLTGGDDYQLCFTVSAEHAAMLEQIALDHGISISHVGDITAEPGIRCIQKNGDEMTIERYGFDHFQKEQ